MKEPLDLPARRRLYLYIKANPGIHFREVQRDLSLSIGQLDFHINELVKKELIVKESGQGTVRFYVRDTFTPQERKIMSFLRKEVTRAILLFIKDHPGASPRDILGEFDFSGPNLSYHLARMVKSGVVRFEQKGRDRRYFIIEESTLEDLLISYSATLLDKVVDIISN